MKYITIICLAFLISCGKKEKTKPVIETPKNSAAEMYTLETKNFFIDVPQGFAVNEMKIANKYAMKDFIKSDSLQYFLIASDKIDSKITIDFNSNFVTSDLSLNDLNKTIYQNYKDQFKNETMDISVQKDTLIGNKQINYLVFSTLFNNKPEQTMYVSIKENNQKINLSFKTDDISNKIYQEKNNWKIIESIGIK